MPPAFNLSQDQTLQFNLCFVASLPAPSLMHRSLNILTNAPLLKRTLLSFSWTFDSLRIPISALANTGRFPQMPTLIDCLFLKIFLLQHFLRIANKSSCSSAAQKRDYAVLLYFCQSVFSSKHTFYLLQKHNQYALKKKTPALSWSFFRIKAWR